MGARFSRRALPPPGNRLLDDRHGRGERRLDIEVAGVEQIGIVRAFQWRGAPPGIAFVAAADFRQDFGVVDLDAGPIRSSAARRAARTSGVAVTKIFTSAFGQITVPMSRPSMTAPGGVAAKSR